MNQSVEEIQQLMRKMIAEELDVEIDHVSLSENFQNLGLDSISSIFMLNELEDKYKIELKPMDLWSHPTITLFSQFVYKTIHANH